MAAEQELDTQTQRHSLLHSRGIYNMTDYVQNVEEALQKAAEQEYPEDVRSLS